MARKYLAVIWPTGYGYRDEIFAHYSCQNKASQPSGITTKEFGGAEDFMRFIYDVYAKDDLSKEILAHKTKIMVRREPLSCAAFSFSYESDVPENRVAEAVLAIKTNARQLIAQKMEDYYYDILFHVTDTNAEYDYLRRVLKQYGFII
jgi:hypothetical protein